MANTKKLTILHSNDMHGDFLADEIDQSLIGGVSMLSGYVNKVRDEVPNTIYVIAGDMFRGSVIDSEFRGLSTIEIVNLLAPNVVSIGNHEIDYGLEHLLFIEKCAKFPIINANLFITINRARLFRPHYIMEVDGMRILFIGIITEEVMAATKNSLIGSFVDIAEAASEVGRICNCYKTTDIDFTVLLTHIGFEEDKKLAALLNPDWGVDVIIGGHSHTFLERPETVNGIPIVQAGTGTDQIGRFDIVVNTDTNAIESYTWCTIPIDASHCPRDTDLENVLNTYKSRTDQKYGRIITRFPHALTHPQRNTETQLGNLMCDILQECLGVEIMLLGSGSIRHETLGPIVTFGNLMEVYPYDDPIHMIKVTGAQLRRMLLYMLRDEAWTGETEFYQLSKGLSLEYSKGKKELSSLTLNGEAVKDSQQFTVGLQEFHFKNIEDFLNIKLSETEENQKPRVIATSCMDVIEEYLSTHAHVNSKVEGRITILP